MLLTSRDEVVRPLVSGSAAVALPNHSSYRPIGDHSNIAAGWSSSPWQPEQPRDPLVTAIPSEPAPIPEMQVGEVDPLYLFARYLEWELAEEPSAAWELLAAGRSSHGDTRAHALRLLASSRHFEGIGASATRSAEIQDRNSTTEMNMLSPYDLEIAENCADCSYAKPGFFCRFSETGAQALNQVSHKNILPAGAILFVEGQDPRGMFILCSGKVNLSTTSREGKILILRTAEAGESIGLSAAISNVGYETTAETATPCVLNFVERKYIVELLRSHNEIGMQVVQCLSRDFQAAYRDIHDLILTRSSAGKLARLLLSQCGGDRRATETRFLTTMTHEEMGQRIGASRETVTRLLSHLKKRKLIRADGPTMVIRDRSALEALTI